MVNKLSKEAFVRLATAYSRQEAYEDELRNYIRNIAKDRGARFGFMGLPVSSNVIMSEVLNLLGYSFKFYYYNCYEDFNKFNKNIFLNDKTHPNVKDFGELWEFEQSQGD